MKTYPDLNAFARFWEGEAPGEPRRQLTRAESPPPGMTRGHLAVTPAEEDRFLSR